MLKIGIECHSLEGTRFGVGQTLIQLLKSLPKNEELRKNFRFVLYFNKKIPSDPILSDPIFEKRILKAPLIPPSFNIFYHILIPIAYLKDNLDGIFLPSYMLPAFLLWGKSITVLTNDVHYEAHQGSLPFRFRISYLIFAWTAAKWGSKVMTITEFSKNELSRLYNIPKEKIAVIPWGLNNDMQRLEKYLVSNQKISELKQRLEIKDRFIISVGQAFPRRKIKEAMLAFEIACQNDTAQSMKNIQYVVACTDKNNPLVIDSLTEEINDRLGRQAILRAKYLSPEDILYLFNNADLLIYISSSEAMGLPPMEALKCGTVPLVADNPLTHEIFGVNAFFVKNIDAPKEIATAMQDALTNAKERNKIIQDGKIAMNKFSWEDFSKKLTRLFYETFN